MGDWKVGEGFSEGCLFPKDLDDLLIHLICSKHFFLYPRSKNMENCSIYNILNQGLP